MLIITEGESKLQQFGDYILVDILSLIHGASLVAVRDVGKYIER